MSVDALDELVKAQKRGEIKGIQSICSSHPAVLQTSMGRAVQSGVPLLIESTCNQVNQFGGYTGMRPADFVSFARSLASKCGLPAGQLILGGDHLGPSAWQNEPEGSAMAKSEQLVRAYVNAGYGKIHLDASMKLADDDSAHPLDVEISAGRTARLAKVSEQARLPGRPAPWYVIGTEVPIPGGAQEHEEGVSVTTVEDARRTIDATHAAFIYEGLESAWERVIALVVQPGVEFGDDFVLDYRPDKAATLSNSIESESHLVYEAHSTDYQKRESLRELVRDHFAILKVGPALTFAYREALFALAMMEKELTPEDECSNLIECMEKMMLEDPHHWKKYYGGTLEEQAFKRKFSLSDRIRYYWNHPEAQAAVEKLLGNLSRGPLPLSLLSQFLPNQHRLVRSGKLENEPLALIQHNIDDVLGDYQYACGN